MSTPQIGVYFSPDLVAKIGIVATQHWAAAVRDWHHTGDPDFYFGRDVSNSKGLAHTWAWHIHYAPEDPTSEDGKMWDRTTNPYYRTSDRLVVYSMDNANPSKYGYFMLAFLDPDGHKKLQIGPNAAALRQNWDEIAYIHQTSGNMPDGTISVG